jgi:hypothetical protein
VIAKDHEHLDGGLNDLTAFHARVLAVHGTVGPTYLRTHLVLMHGATSADVSDDKGWGALKELHTKMHEES